MKMSEEMLDQVRHGVAGGTCRRTNKVEIISINYESFYVLPGMQTVAYHICYS